MRRFEELRGFQLRPRVVGMLAVASLGAVAVLYSGPPLGTVQPAWILPAAITASTGNFPLFLKVSYEKTTGAVSVKGSALPGTVVQVSNASTVVRKAGTYALKTSLPLSLVAVRDGKIRRFRFDLPPKAKPHLASLVVNADLSNMRSSVSGQLTMTQHPPATVVVQHGQKGTKHQAAISKGQFTISGLPLVRGLNTLHWWLQLGIITSPGPDINFTVE